MLKGSIGDWLTAVCPLVDTFLLPLALLQPILLYIFYFSGKWYHFQGQEWLAHGRSFLLWPQGCSQLNWQFPINHWMFNNQSLLHHLLTTWGSYQLSDVGTHHTHQAIIWWQTYFQSTASHSLCVQFVKSIAKGKISIHITWSCFHVI